MTTLESYALITGASSGLGEEYARQLAARGWKLVLVARSGDRLEALRDDLMVAHPGIDVRPIALDLTAPGACKSLFEQTQAANLEVTLLINNAGFGAFGEFATLDPDKLRQMVELNVAAVVELSRLYLSRMIQQSPAQRRTGGIINIASVAGFLPLPFSTVYAATKAFVVSFSHALYQEARSHGVHVMVVNPGSTKTNFFRVAGRSPWSNPRRMQTATEVVEESLRAFDRGRVSVTTGFSNRVNVMMAGLLPRSWAAAAVGYIVRRYTKHNAGSSAPST